MTLDEFLKDISIDLAPVQQRVLKDMILNNNSMAILPRAGGKTFLLALAALWKARCNRNQRICMTAAVYMQAKWMVKGVLKWSEQDTVFGSNFCSITFDNGSIIIGLPISDIIGKDFDYILVDEYQSLPAHFRDYIDRGSINKVSIMVDDGIGSDRLVELITNRYRCYKISKYSTADFPKGFYDEDILSELEKFYNTVRK